MKGKLLVFLLFFNIISCIYSKMTVVYPDVNGEGEKLLGYAVLKLVLENSGLDYELEISKEKMNNSRIRAMIKSGEISIADFGTSVEFEEELRAVYFPIDLGLNGWRIFLIHKDNIHNLNRLTDLEDLKKYLIGQGIGWSDSKILRDAGLAVYEAPQIINLMRMLEKKRIDLFPLGVNEANYLLDLNKTLAKDVTVDENIVLIYPFARFFFVNKENKELHDAVEKGLKKSFENGSFWKLFISHKSNRALFEKVNLKNRRQIFIKNPNLTDEFYKIPDEYFFNIDMLKNE